MLKNTLNECNKKIKSIVLGGNPSPSQEVTGVKDGNAPATSEKAEIAGAHGTAIQGHSERQSAMGEQHLSMLFRGYFNNKMTLLVFLIQTKRYRLEGRSAQLACGFLDDMYRHMLPEGLQRQYRLVFVWLKKFFMKLPDVSLEQRSKASRFIFSLYDAFGINLNKGGQV